MLLIITAWSWGYAVLSDIVGLLAEVILDVQQCWPTLS